MIELTERACSLEDLLKACIEKKSSDLHLSTGQYPVIRVDGDVVTLEDFGILESDHIYEMITGIMNTYQKEQYDTVHDCDFSIDRPGLSRFRVNCFKHNRGCAAVLRTIPSTILTMEDLKLPPIFKKLCEYPRGIILVTGPTGSGKSTTLAAMIDHINSNRKDHILTIEDPIEFVHQNKQSLVSQREVHRDTESFEAALRAALREDPDIILVGEMRDLETIRLALTAAETGHLVFGTLHTTSATKTIDRIVDVFPADEKDMVRTMLSESLQAVISQALLKKMGGGRVAAHEIMVGTPAIRNLIRENKLAQMHSSIETGSNEGMISLDQSLKALVNSRTVSNAAARSIAKKPDTFSG